MKTSNLINMAKKTKTTTKPSVDTIKKVVTKKTTEAIVKVEEPVIEDRDTKAKKTVEKLLEGLSLNPYEYKKKEEVIEEDGEYDETNNTGSDEWLEQQVTELTQANEYLRNQLANISPVQNSRNNNSDVILEDTESNVKVNVVNLFLEIQTAYMNVGFNYNNGIPKSNLIIHPEAFINRLLNFFPFLEEYRKIQLP